MLPRRCAFLPREWKPCSWGAFYLHAVKRSSGDVAPARHLMTPPSELAFDVLARCRFCEADRLVKRRFTMDVVGDLAYADRLHDRLGERQIELKKMLHLLNGALPDHIGKSCFRPCIELTAVRDEEK